MIVSVSRRTDIPAFYAEWFLNRVREGFVLVRHPFRPRQIERVSLSPKDVDALVFWTRNADPLIPYLDEIDSRGYRYYFLSNTPSSTILDSWKDLPSLCPENCKDSRDSVSESGRKGSSGGTIPSF